LAQQIRILLVEDDLNDAQMVMAEVGCGDFIASFVHVADRAAALAALDEGGWDLIITDFSLPDMTGFANVSWIYR
jgi:two-component system cell cycle sensor histidine kinase/response regulator CckA